MMRWLFCLWGPVGAASMGTLAPWVPSTSSSLVDEGMFKLGSKVMEDLLGAVLS